MFKCNASFKKKPLTASVKYPKLKLYIDNSCKKFKQAGQIYHPVICKVKNMKINKRGIGRRFFRNAEIINHKAKNL